MTEKIWCLYMMKFSKYLIYMQKYFQIVITHVILAYLFNSFIFLSTIRWTHS